MSRIREAFELFFRRPSDDEGDSHVQERTGRELKGSILVLAGLFQLVSLTSYLPIDSFNLAQGRLDHMNNLGGIVGAALGEAFMGSVGIMGYSMVLLTAWLAVGAFRGISIRGNWYRVTGWLIGTLLLAIACRLLLQEEFPEASLWQGGLVGRYAGDFLKRYFNIAGSLLIVGGSFLVNLILTAGFSFLSFAQNVFGSDESEAEEEAAPPAKKLSVVPAPAPVAAVAAAPAPPPKKTRSRRKPKAADGEADPAAADPANPDAGDTAAQAPASNGEYKFQDLIPYTGSYSHPSARLLKAGSAGKKLSRGEARRNADKICEHLLSFQITGEVVAVSQGPVLTTYEFKPSAGMKLSKIAGLQDDLGIVMGTRDLRIVAPIPGKNVVGIEIPRPSAEVIALKDLVDSKEFGDRKLRVPFALGKSTEGTPLIGDIAATPHMLVAGSTGSGKSVFINSLIISFLYRMSPQELRLILVDPKMLEMSIFDGLPHLVAPVITEAGVAYNALSWACTEMDRRYKVMAETNAKNIESYNSKRRNAAEKFPYIVIVVDELADLMLSGGEAVEVNITRLAQKARAAGIHLVLATQRPSTDIVTGLIKANIPSRLAFKVTSGVDSRTILDTSGAEELIGRGDSLMITPGAPLRRIHGSYVGEEELARVVKSVKNGKTYTDYYIDFGGKPKED